MTSPITVNFPAISLISQDINVVIPAGQPIPLIGGMSTNVFSGQNSTFYNFPSGVSSALILVNETATNYSGATFTVTGVDSYNKNVSITVAGPTASGTRNIANAFHKITNFTCSIDINASFVLLYSNGNGYVDFTVDYYNSMGQCTLQYTDMNAPGSAVATNYTQYYTMTPPMLFQDGQYINNTFFYTNLFQVPLTNTNIILSPTTDTVFPLTDNTIISMRNVPVVAFRTVISYSDPTDIGFGAITVTLLQQGARY